MSIHPAKAPARNGCRRSVPSCAVKAEVPHPVRRQSAAVTPAAERGRRRGNNSKHSSVGKEKALGGCRALFDDRHDVPYRRARSSRISAREKTLSMGPLGSAHPRPMYSMKRTSAPCCFPNSSSSASSSSLTPARRRYRSWCRGSRHGGRLKTAKHLRVHVRAESMPGIGPREAYQGSS